MTDPLQVDPGGLIAFGAKCDEHGGYVTGAAIPPPMSPAALGQGTGQASAALHALVAELGAAMGRELIGLGGGAAGASAKFAGNETNAAANFKDVLGPVSEMLGAGTKPVGDAFGAFGKAIENVPGAAGSAASGGLQALSQMVTHGGQPATQQPVDQLTKTDSSRDDGRGRHRSEP